MTYGGPYKFSESQNPLHVERRRHARLECQLAVGFLDQAQDLDLFTTDLSLGGAYVPTGKPHPVGHRLRAYVHLPSHLDPVLVVAQVARVVEKAPLGFLPGMGLRFSIQNPDSRQTVMNYLLQQVSQTGDPTRKILGKRLVPRLKRRIWLRYSYPGGMGTSTSRDISTCGVFIQTPEPPTVGTDLQVHIQHPVTFQDATLPGKVVRAVGLEPARVGNQPGVGVCFDDATRDHKQLLAEFLRNFILQENTPVETERRDNPE
jgi:Tfp pilus assembly protein PilZ